MCGPVGLTLNNRVCLRDLKVSNLLMTDKGCVKIGELSSSSLSLSFSPALIEVDSSW